MVVNKRPLTKEEFDAKLKPILEENFKLKMELINLSLEMATVLRKQDEGFVYLNEKFIYS